MTITQNDIGNAFTLVGVEGHTYTLVWFSDSQDRCGVVPSWAVTPTEFTVRLSRLRRIT